MDGGFQTDDPEEVDRHFWLTRSVARVAGVNLTRALVTGSLSVADYGDMVAECRARGCRAACEGWLARQADWPAAPPPFCAHARILGELRRRQRPQ